MKPQSAQRKTLCTQKEFPLKEITDQIIACAIEVHKTLGPDLLINFNVERLKAGIKRLII